MTLEHVWRVSKALKCKKESSLVTWISFLFPAYHSGFVANESFHCCGWKQDFDTFNEISNNETYLSLVLLAQVRH